MLKAIDVCQQAPDIIDQGRKNSLGWAVGTLIAVGFMILASRTCTHTTTHTPTHTHPAVITSVCLTASSVCTHAYVYAAHSARQLINGCGILLNVTMVTALKLHKTRVGWHKRR